MRDRHIAERLTAYVDGQLSSEERRQVEEHLARCSACRHELETLGRLWTFIDDGLRAKVEDEEPIPALWPAIAVRIERERIRRRRWLLPWMELWWRLRDSLRPLQWARSPGWRTPYAYALASAIILGFLAGAGLEYGASMPQGSETIATTQVEVLEPADYSSLIELPEESFASLFFGADGANSSGSLNSEIEREGT
ncbi:hypothetical protein AMJ39_09180 [candidate division TA06 bacterium DG_24]|uniref:Putative zinc-finger domain-containing protein n=3 Tax=Bacteria division TA06 TaxID=1156500 RepID=A0A0S8JBV4_UNCT6|nr:MAG: hypothetical protein AMJ39_09180 [candidate division TA06 bacterium DG_24]KPK67804.1 MAG: hypothetical protein AMJ82_09825 [candidate division TA06 bacterium SM23_40]KPL05947.1 MAG: hypothetical protein AMJ71_10360 [candidate division TA06 bacterium SM1_40]